MQECLEAMLEEERQHDRNIRSTAWSTATGMTENNSAELCQQLNGLRVHDELAKKVSKVFCEIESSSINKCMDFLSEYVESPCRRVHSCIQNDICKYF